MKESLKRWIYALAYSLRVLARKKPDFQVMSVDETIDALQNSRMSLVRYGDGEILIMEGRLMVYNDYDERLGKALKEILAGRMDGMLVTISDIFGTLKPYHKKSREFWRMHLFHFRKTYLRHCDPDYLYGNTFVSRPYYSFSDKTKCAAWVERLKKVWEGCQCVIVEGPSAHNGVETRLFDNVATLERIVGPPRNANKYYDIIMEKCLSYDKSTLFLVSLGPTAKILARDLHTAGYRVIDIGNLDMEYSWCLMNAGNEKLPIPKHQHITRAQNIEAGYDEYLSQIVYVVEDEEFKF